jgi:hypothetical protein
VVDFPYPASAGRELIYAIGAGESTTIKTQSEAGRAAMQVAYFHNPKKEKANTVSHM